MYLDGENAVLASGEQGLDPLVVVHEGELALADLVQPEGLAVPRGKRICAKRGGRQPEALDPAQPEALDPAQPEALDPAGEVRLCPKGPRQYCVHMLPLPVPKL